MITKKNQIWTAIKLTFSLAFIAFLVLTLPQYILLYKADTAVKDYLKSDSYVNF